MYICLYIYTYRINTWKSEINIEIVKILIVLLKIVFSLTIRSDCINYSDRLIAISTSRHLICKSPSCNRDRRKIERERGITPAFERGCCFPGTPCVFPLREAFSPRTNISGSRRARWITMPSHQLMAVGLLVVFDRPRSTNNRCT